MRKASDQLRSAASPLAPRSRRVATVSSGLARLRVRAAGHTLLIATHLRREAALADRLLRIDHGRVVQDLRRGTPEFEAALSALRPD